MRKVVALAVALLCLLVAQTSGQSVKNRSARDNKAEQAVLNQMEKWITALKRNDIRLLDEIIADDFKIVDADGRVLSKEQDLETVKSGDVKFESISTEDVKVFVYGDTAIVSGIAEHTFNYKGRASTIRERFFDVFQKRKGRWWVIASSPTAMR
jgi:ketosteroid isomerase-like protein